MMNKTADRRNGRKIMAMILACVIAAGLLAGCGDNGGSHGTNKKGGVADVLEQRMNEENGTTSTPTPTAAAQNDPAGERKPGGPNTSAVTDVDIDLTQLGTSLVYSEIYNMEEEPSKYVGKKVKIDGTFMVAYSEELDQYYYLCVVTDETACCSVWLEFVPQDTTFSYPDNCPEQESRITVVGEFQTYMEGSDLYCTLKDAVYDQN